MDGKLAVGGGKSEIRGEIRKRGGCVKTKVMMSRVRGDRHRKRAEEWRSTGGKRKTRNGSYRRVCC